MASASKFNDTSLFYRMAQEHPQHSSGGSRFDTNRHQFSTTNHEMQTLLTENIFEDALTDNSSFTALLGLPTSEAASLLQQPSFCSEAFPGDVIVGEWAQNGHFGADSGSFSSENFAIGPTACLATIPSDPGFVERAAKFSSFASGIQTIKAEESANALSGISSGNSKEAAIDRNIVCAEESEKELPKFAKENRFKKRKTAQTSVKAANSEPVKAKRWKGANSNVKNTKDDVIEDSKAQMEKKPSSDNNSSEIVPKKAEDHKNSKDSVVVEKSNYIHVRARRGQATDSHSLAERVRREKISERMKLLQDLVPGCNKITGKAVMLDEIINHVQCLQRQVEFLSMKLATVNPSLDFDVDLFFAKEMMNTAPCGGNSSISQELTTPLSTYLQYNNLEQGSQQTVAASRSDVTSAWNNELQNTFTVGLVHDRHSPFGS